MYLNEADIRNPAAELANAWNRSYALSALVQIEHWAKKIFLHTSK